MNIYGLLEVYIENKIFEINFNENETYLQC